VQKVNAGPGLTTAIVFQSKGTKIRMTVTCVAGIPTTVNLPL
jgi:eukaryotic-like serine/threonine-protein kinase